MTAATEAIVVTNRKESIVTKDQFTVTPSAVRVIAGHPCLSFSPTQLAAISASDPCNTSDLSVAITSYLSSTDG
jgi:hypothetical protein